MNANVYHGRNVRSFAGCFTFFPLLYFKSSKIRHTHSVDLFERKRPLKALDPDRRWVRIIGGDQHKITLAGT